MIYLFINYWNMKVHAVLSDDSKIHKNTQIDSIGNSIS